MIQIHAKIVDFQQYFVVSRGILNSNL